MNAGRKFLQESEEIAVLHGIRLTILQSHDPIFVVDDQGVILLTNEAAGMLTFPDVPDTIGALGSTDRSDPASILRTALRRAVPTHMRLTLAGGRTCAFSIRRMDFQRRDGRQLAMIQADSAIRMVSEALVGQFDVETARDRLRQSLAQQADLRREAQQLRRLASTDQLTGLLNAGAFSRRVTDLLSRSEAEVGTLLYLDLNGFKEVNDRFGHAAGDAVLRCAALRLRAELRKQDPIARLGGDEFGIWLSGISGGARERVICRLKRRLSEPMTLSQVPVHIGTVSAALGYARWPEDGTDVGSLLKKADSRMYTEKNKRAVIAPLGATTAATTARCV